MTNVKLRTIVAKDDGTGNIKKRSITLSNVNEEVSTQTLSTVSTSLASLVEGVHERALKITEEEL
jgi:hypothetical protein